MNYNPKIDYLFCKYLYNKPFEIIDEQEWKNIYNGLKEPKNEAQVGMMRSKEITEFIKKQETEFNIFSVKKCFKMLSNHDLILDKPKEKLLTDLILFVKAGAEADLAGKVLIKVLKETIFPEEWNVEMSKIMHNFIEWKNGNTPSILYRFQMSAIQRLIDKNEIDGALLEVKNVYQRTRHFNEKHKVVSFSKIKERLYLLESYLKEKFGITEFYVYGSYARGEENEYSDLDIFVKVETRMQQDLDNKFLLFSFLENELGIGVDGKVEDLSYLKSRLRIDMVRHLIKIF